MLNSNRSLWPLTAANGDDANAGADPWGLGAALETQARLWNHLLDANRSFWSLYTPWLPVGPWAFGAAVTPLPREEEGEEPAQTADGVPDALESQARSWNHFLDAQRSFWTAAGWPTPGLAPWMTGPDENASAHHAADVIESARQTSSRAKPAPRKPKTARSRSR
jgi:hypothetical protein